MRAIFPEMEEAFVRGEQASVLLGPALCVAWRSPRASGWQPQALPLLLATLVVLAVFDALLNSFIFFPAITAAGGLAVAQENDHAGD